MIELHALCYYPAYGDYKSSDYPPRNLIKALKGQPFNGYSDLRGVDGIERRIQAGNQAAALAHFGAWAAHQIKSLGLTNSVLVPIPSSSHTKQGAPFTANSMCEAIIRSGVNLKIVPCLTQREAVLGSSKGGSRKYVDIRDNLVCHASFHGERVIMVDDVKTSGNHLKAAAEQLRRRGAVVKHAICAGKTVWERQANMLSVPVTNIDWDANQNNLFA